MNIYFVLNSVKVIYKPNRNTIEFHASLNAIFEWILKYKSPQTKKLMHKGWNEITSKVDILVFFI